MVRCSAIDQIFKSNVKFIILVLKVKFLDVVHTDIYFASTSTVIGHVDYYPNQGAWQRGCPSIALSIISSLVFNMNATKLEADGKLKI